MPKPWGGSSQAVSHPYGIYLFFKSQILLCTQVVPPTVRAILFLKLGIQGWFQKR